MHRDTHLVQPHERARSDATNDDRVYSLVIERLHRVACTMRVVLIAIVDRRNAVFVRVDNDKYRRRSKVVVHGALNPIIILDRKTDLHMTFLLMHYLLRLFKHDSLASAQGFCNPFSRTSKHSLNGSSRHAHTRAGLRLSKIIQIAEL
jgi:hypothetical protein